ncbi:centromere protein F [Gastrophryne carolinensis]
MSWVVDEWKEGLPSKTLQKIQELESQLDKLKKERQQRQFQLESLEAAFQKQKQKAESEKSEVSALKRENQSLIELCDNQEKTRQKMTHDQQVKDTQINFLEGQLSAGKKHIEKLEQELKRFKSDLERSQLSISTMDMSLCTTPQKSCSASFTPVKVSDSKYEELQEKYAKEVEERKKLETELKILQIKMVNQSSQQPSQNSMNHRDIARHQSSSSVFSWQQERTPSRASSSGGHDTSLKRSFASTQCPPWEQEETPSKRGFRSDSSNRSFCEASNPANEQLKNQNQELRSRVTELELRLQVQEKDLKTHLNKLQETQNLLEKTQAELQERDRVLTKSRDDQARATAQYEQSAERCAQAEQKLKKVTEELSCQRQNAESARLTAENKLKEREKENQQELLRQQTSLNNMEQQLNQMKTRLSQESQQAKNEFNAKQSELDRVVHSKKVLESEVEELKQKLLRAEQTLQASENQMVHFKKSLEEAKSQQNTVQCQLDQRSKEAAKLDEELNVANQTLRQNQHLIDQLTNQNNSLEMELKRSLQKIQDSADLQNVKVSLSNIEKERDLVQELLKKKEREVTETKATLSRMADESLELKNRLDCKEEECKDLINTNIALSKWKDAHENDAAQFSREKGEMQSRLKELESGIQCNMDRTSVLENDKTNLLSQIKTLQELVDVKADDLEAQKVTCLKIQQQLESESQKYQNDTDTLVKKIYELEAEIKLRETSDFSSRVSFLEEELQKQRALTSELQNQHDEHLKSKMDLQNQLLQVNEMHEQFASDCQSQVESLQGSLSSKQNDADSLAVAIREKDEELRTLSEKLRLANTDLETTSQSNKELNATLQKLNLLSESWSTERESLTSLINSNQKEIEKLTAEMKQADERRRLQNDEKRQVSEASVGLNLVHDHCKNIAVDSMEEECNVDKECGDFKMEIEEWKEKYDRIQKENGRLLRANEELSVLLGNLRNNELLLSKNAEELRVSLKDKEASLKKLLAQLELLKTNSEFKSSPVSNANKSFEDIQSRLASSVEGSIKTPFSPTVKENQAIFPEEHSVLFADGNESNLLVDLNETLGKSVEPQHREENRTLLINLDQLSLTSLDDTRPLSHLLELSQVQAPPVTPLLSFSSPTIKENHDESCGRKEGRRSISSELVDLILQQPPEQQQVLFSGLDSEDTSIVKDLLTVYQVELSNLQKQHLAEIASWQQKLKDQTSEMEAKLAEEKARSNQLIQDLEAAKLDLQVLDLSARSLLFDSDELTARLDTANQSLCTVLPIARLSLDNSMIVKSETLNLDQGSSEESPRETSERELTKVGKNRRSTRQKKKRKTSAEVSPQLCLKTKASPNENEKLLLLIREKEHLNKKLAMELKDLALQIEIQKAELGNKEEQSQELENKAKELEGERVQLLEKLELICSEKLQSTNRIVEVEKALHEALTVLEQLKSQIAQLSALRDGLEISNQEWKENCLQAENELKRIKSDKANIENHALSLEADFESLQSKCQHLQEQSEGHLRSLNALEESLKVGQTEKKQLTQELESMVEEKEELEQMYKKLKERENELESCYENAKELIKILESDIRTLKEEVQVAKSTSAALTAERDHVAGLRENDTLQIQEMQNQLQLMQEEKQLLIREQEELQTKLNAACEEKQTFLQSLERSQFEKHEMGTRLNSAQEEASLMRAGIEKLKVKIESDEKKRQQAMERLRESERKFDSLNDKIESLERELVMAEENLENAVLQTETAQEEAESLRLQKKALEDELNDLRQKLMDLERELQDSRMKIIELETSIATLTYALKQRETEHAQEKDSTEKQLEVLQTQMKDLLEQNALSGQKSDAVIAEHAIVISKLEEEKAQLLQQLENAEVTSSTLRLDLEQKLQDNQMKITELELSIASFKDIMEKKETECAHIKNSSEKDLELLQVQINNLHEQKALSDQKYDSVIEEHANIVTKLEEERMQLLKELEDAQVAISDLKHELEQKLQASRQKIMELEMSIATLTDTLKEKEMGHAKFKDSTEQELEMLQTQINDLHEQKTLSEQKYDSVVAKHANILTKLEEGRAQLLQQLEDAQVAGNDLKHELEQKLQASQLKIMELEMSIATLTDTLKEKETEHAKVRDSSEQELEMLQTQIMKLQEQKALSDQKYDAFVFENANIVTRLEEERTQLLEQLADTQVASSGLNLDLESKLQASQMKIMELEMSIATLTDTLKEKETEHAKIKDSTEKDLEVLQTQMKDLCEQKALSDHRSAEHANAVTKLEEERKQLVQKMEDAQLTSSDLKSSIDRLNLELEECKLQLAEKTQYLVALESCSRDAEELKVVKSAELSQFQIETENLRNEKMTLLSKLEELEANIITTSSENDAFQVTITDLKSTCSELETQLASVNSERMTLLEKGPPFEPVHEDALAIFTLRFVFLVAITPVAELTEEHSSKLQDADLHLRTIQEQNCQQRKLLEEEIQTIRQQLEEKSALLQAAASNTSALQETISSLQNELESQSKKHQEDLSEYEGRLQQADVHSASVLEDLLKQHKEDLDGYQEKLISMEALLAGQKLENESLHATSEELKESLFKAQEQVATLQAHIEQMTQEHAAACDGINQWMNSCKQLEEEKEDMRKHIVQQEEALRSLTQTPKSEEQNSSASEIEELKRCLEEKTLEADESVEKYCNLMIESHRLEDDNDTLRKQVDFLSSMLQELETKKGQGSSSSSDRPPPDSPSLPSSSEKPEIDLSSPSSSEQPPLDLPSLPSSSGEPHLPPLPSSGQSTPDAECGRRKSRRSAQGHGKQSNKRQRECNTPGSVTATPQCVTKRLRKINLRTEEDYEPEGLPEVVSKGFGDIPSGKQSPYVLRRTAAPLRKSPRLASQSNSPSLLTTNDLENLAELSSPTPGGSKSQPGKASKPLPMDTKSPLTAHNKPKRRVSAASRMDVAYVQGGHDDTEEEGNCNVQ